MCITRPGGRISQPRRAPGFEYSYAAPAELQQFNTSHLTDETLRHLASFLFFLCRVEAFLVGMITSYFNTEVVLLAFVTTAAAVTGIVLFSIQTKFDITGKVSCWALRGFQAGSVAGLLALFSRALGLFQVMTEPGHVDERKVSEQGCWCAQCRGEVFSSARSGCTTVRM